MTTIAVTGATGTVGAALMPQLEADPRAGRVVAVAGDVRDPDGLREAFAGADVVVHLAFDTIGARSRAAVHAVNVEGTLNAVRAAKAAGVRRFVFASSVAAYGFHADNPVPMDEDWPTRPSDHFFYARQKAELESRLRELAVDLELYLVRPAIVLGENPAGAKLPGPLPTLVNGALRSVGRSLVPVPVPVPDFPVQVVHEVDLGAVFVECALGDAPAGAYNAAADGVLTGPDVARELGFAPVAIPQRLTRAAARGVAALPLAPAALEWVEAGAHPAIMDTTRAKRDLHWTPRHTALDTLRVTLGRS